jgi:hypothetical protein
MSKPEDQLENALVADGNFDAERARRAAAEAGSWFDSRMRWAARVMLLRAVVLLAVCEFAVVSFCFAFSMKMMLGCALLLLVALGMLGFVAIRWVVADGKLGLLKEIKLLRLQQMGCPADSLAPPDRETVPTGVSPLRTLSRWEGTAWGVALAVVAIGSAYFTNWLMLSQGRLIHESHVTLTPDGAGSQVFKVSYPYLGLSPLTSASTYTGAGTYAITQWIDDHGRELPLRVSTVDRNRRYTVEFVEPVMPSEQVSYTLKAMSPQMAEKQGDAWMYRGDPMYGCGTNVFLATVDLPPGARIVYVDPPPARQSVSPAGLPRVVFQGTRGQNEKFVHTIVYRLPQPGGALNRTKP